ncbi:helix-turn-helix domain-containing protein [Inquilinus sp. CAU 1745]|uniref:helix-turn-helix domain-containing protein n=1 Tax=Inquilinus sp. CAU 1745 TaxID=3140369 RepID=UPI00325B9B7B
MPKVEPDNALLQAVEAVVQSAGGNQSEAARRLGTSRLRISRILKQQGGATPAVRYDLWRKLKPTLSDGPSSQRKDTKKIQGTRDVPSVALQLLRYMTDAIERDIKLEGQSHAE